MPRGMSVKKLLLRMIRKVVVPVCPRAHRLALRYWLSGWASTCEPEIEQIPSYCKIGGTAVDVGANDGLVSYRLSRIFSKVYAFEANPDVTQDLRSTAVSRIEIFDVGLSSRDGEATLHIPVRGFELTGWASLSTGNLPGSEEITRAVSVRRLDGFGLTDISFIKIDVEGHELDVLMGGRDTIDANRPVLLVEIKPENLEGVTSFLTELGYARYRLKELTAIEGMRENYIFIASSSSDAPA